MNSTFSEEHNQEALKNKTSDNHSSGGSKTTGTKYLLRAKPGHYDYRGNSVDLSRKWGDISWAYFPIAYTILLTLSVSIIQTIETLNWFCRVVLIVSFAVLEFYFCFFNRKFKDLIVRFFEKSRHDYYK